MPIVGAVLGAVSIASSLAGGILGGVAKRDAMYQGAALTDEQANLTGEQTEEQVRRFQLQAGQEVGRARAAVGASGFATTVKGGTVVGNSMNKYVDALSAEFSREASWLDYAGHKTAGFQHMAADAQRSAADAGLWGDVLSGVSGALGGAGRMFSGLGGNNLLAGGSSGGGTDNAWMSQNPLGGASST